MIYRKLKADYLFTGYRMLNDKHVLICNENGIIQDIIPSTESSDQTEIFNGILCPGFINCHCHLELSHLKGVIPENTGLTDFVFKVINLRHFKEEEIYESIERAEAEMLANGIVAVGDICNNLFSFRQKQKQRMTYYNFVEVSGWLPGIATARFEKSKMYYEVFNQLPYQKNFLAMAPHAPYSVSDELWRFLAPYFRDKTTSIHNQETAAEDEFFKFGTGDLLRMYEMMKIDNSFYRPGGKSSLQTYLPKLESAKNVLLVHNTFIREDDLQFCQEFATQNDHKTTLATNKFKIFFCLCVNANQYIENTLPPIELLRKYHCTVVLGTDSLASNHSLNIAEEIKTISRNFPSVPLQEILEWATINGAKALQLDAVFGSFEPGKQPGIVLIENCNGQNLQGNSSVRRIV